MIISCAYSVFSQVRIEGDIIDSETQKSLAYVNLGIKEKNIGGASRKNGSFFIKIPSDYLDDTLTFSMVGYHELNVPIKNLDFERRLTVRLIEKIKTLNEVVVLDEKFVQRKYGIKRRGLIHFTDGMFKEDDSFEIGQLIDLGNSEAQITSLNLHINESRSDSATFRINFYRYDEDENRPASRIIEKNILQRHAIREGWLKFDLMEYDVLVKGKIMVSIEFIPEHKTGIRQIFYEVKLGGFSKSFYRRNSLGQWNVPPHHYCFYVTALVDRDAPEEPEEKETVPAIILKSNISKEPFSIFVRLPKDYQSNIKKKYPVIYHVDGNAFFDPVTASVDRLSKKKKILSDPIVVGIGYENAYVMDSLRNRDYTFPKALPRDSFHISGGGERFYHFIKTELKPCIERTYRTDTANSTLMGHSLGGYFVLYALIQDIAGNKLFNHYVAASPSISYYDNYIPKQFQDLSAKKNYKNKVKLYLTIGEMEIDEDPNDGFNTFGKILSRQDFIQLRMKVYRNLEHMGTAVPSFEDGLEFILAD